MVGRLRVLSRYGSFREIDILSNSRHGLRRFVLVVLALGLLQPTWTLALQVRVQPYVTWITRTSATIQWETDVPGSSVVEYGLDDGYGQIASASGETNMHMVVVSNLVPATRYHYRATTEAGEDTVHSVACSFGTAVEPGSPFRFAFLGDTHTWDPGPVFPPETVQVANGIRAHDPDLVVHSGDLVQGTVATNRSLAEEQYRVELFGTSSNLLTRTPYMVAIGDHERRAVAGDQVYAAYFSGHESPYWGKTYYTFTYGSARFIMLDCVITSDHAAGVEVPGLTFGSAQYNWLVDVLENNTLPWIFLVYHYATYHSHPRFQARDGEMRALLGPLCDRYGVDMVFTGHAHLYERSHPIRGGVRDDAGGAVYVTAGIGGGSLMSTQGATELTATNFTCWGYGIVEIDGSDLTMTLRDIGGGVRDTFSMQDRPPRQAGVTEDFESYTAGAWNTAEMAAMGWAFYDANQNGAIGAQYGRTGQGLRYDAGNDATPVWGRAANGVGRIGGVYSNITYFVNVRANGNFFKLGLWNPDDETVASANLASDGTVSLEVEGANYSLGNWLADEWLQLDLECDLGGSRVRASTRPDGWSPWGSFLSGRTATYVQTYALGRGADVWLDDWSLPGVGFPAVAGSVFLAH